MPLANGKAIDDSKKAAIRQYLNSTWNKYSISWEVDFDNEFYVSAKEDDYNKQFINGFTEQDWAEAWDDGDKFFSNYSSIQKAINRRYNTYAKGINKYDDTHMYVFILPEDKTRELGQLGDMPLGEQWGYLFVNNFGEAHYRTLSHELGHGRTALQHTFKDDYLVEGKTTNLMDYPSTGSGNGGTNLVRAQWNMVHNPAIFTPLQSDEDGASYSIDDEDEVSKFLNMIACANLSNNSFAEFDNNLSPTASTRKTVRFTRTLLRFCKPRLTGSGF